MSNNPRYPQDLHVHSVFSRYDSAIVPEQTPDLIARVGHAEVIGISDHFEHFADTEYDVYKKRVRRLGMRLGTEVDGAASVSFASSLEFDYYVYHCRDRAEDYAGAERLLATGRPVIIAHPNALETDLSRVPGDCLIELNNRYIWRCDWRAFYGPYRQAFGFVISSDAHQPHWLNQSVARRAAEELGIEEVLLQDLLQPVSS